MAVLAFCGVFGFFGAIRAPHSLHFADRAPICFPHDGQDLYPLFFLGAGAAFFFAIGFAFFIGECGCPTRFLVHIFHSVKCLSRR